MKTICAMAFFFCSIALGCSSSPENAPDSTPQNGGNMPPDAGNSPDSRADTMNGQDAGTDNIAIDAENTDTGNVSDAGASAPLTATVTYPFLLPNPTKQTDYFPTEFAHLLGKPLAWTDISTSLVCFSIMNPNASSTSVNLYADLTGYSTPFDQYVNVPAHSTIKPCVNPIAALGPLYALSSEVPGQVHARVTAQGDATPILDDVHKVTIATGQTDFFGKFSGQGWTNLFRYESVFSMPADAAVQMLLAPIAARSRWGTFGEGGYGMHTLNGSPVPMLPIASVVPPANYLYDRAYFVAGEMVTLRLTGVSCTGCTSQAVDFFALNQDEFTQFEPSPCAGGIGTIVNGANSPAGATFKITAPSDGWYYFVFRNICSNTYPTTISFDRTGTHADTVIDTLSAIFNQLKAQGITYTSIAASFFDPSSSQTIRWPRASLTDNTANCVDGSMLFASLVEAFQLEPVVTFVQGHAFMSVRQTPGNQNVWPVETTMLGTSTFEEAMSKGIDEITADTHLHSANVSGQATHGAPPGAPQMPQPPR
jgi:hypothetical protein